MKRMFCRQFSPLVRGKKRLCENQLLSGFFSPTNHSRFRFQCFCKMTSEWLGTRHNTPSWYFLRTNRRCTRTVDPLVRSRFATMEIQKGEKIHRKSKMRCRKSPLQDLFLQKMPLWYPIFGGPKMWCCAKGRLCHPTKHESDGRGATQEVED